MNWDDCSKLIKPGEHSVFSPSQPAFFGYSKEKLLEVYRNKQAAAEGTKYHEFAAKCITLGERLEKRKRTLNMYVNDAIHYKMDPEVRLYFSTHFSGTADTIQYYEKKKFLRIHDLKTGISKASMAQLEGYAALFFLQYGQRLRITPEDCGMEFRIYQMDEIIAYEPDPEDIRFKMDVYVDFEAILSEEDGYMKKSKGVFL